MWHRLEVASCYGSENHQVRTATGEHCDPAGLTAATAGLLSERLFA
jgi:rare lipoprotein A (peptidoglycan hydrolase)